MSLLFPNRFAETSVSIPNVDLEDVGWRRLGSAPRDLLGQQLTRAQNLSVDLYRANPIANRLIRIYTSFLAGDGFAVEATNPEVQAIIDEAWTADRNRLDRLHPGYSRDFMLFGEAVHPVVADKAGNTTFGYIDPTTIQTVHRNPRHNMILTKVDVRAGFDTESLDIVHRDTDILSDDAGLLAGEVFFWPHDRIGASTRGTPFMLPILDWLDAYDQVLWEHVERIKALRAFFWDVEVDGGPKEIEKAKRLWGLTPPKSGSVRFRTPAFRVTAESPQLGTGEDVKSLTFLLRTISAGGGVAPHWLSEPEDANRSTAERMDIPVIRGLGDIQSEWKANIEDAVKFVVDRKVAAGLVARTLPEQRKNDDGTFTEQPNSEKAARDHVRVVVPEIDDEGIEQAATSLAQVAQAFTQFDSLGVIGPKVMSKIVHHLLPALGVPADELPDEDADDETNRSALRSFANRSDPVDAAVEAAVAASRRA